MNKLLIGILSFIIIFFFVARVETIQADTLVIQDNGAVILLIGPGAVLGETTSVPQPTKPQARPEVKEVKKEEPHKTVPLINPETKSIVKITPPTTEDKKIQITITTLPKTPTPAVKNQGMATKTQLPTPLITTPSITKTVDSVVAQDSVGNNVLDIRPAGKNSLTINNENVAVNTSLPLQINTQTHEFDAISQGQTQKINVLPAIAVNSVNLPFSTGTISGSSVGIQPIVSLISTKDNVVYQIQAENKIKLLDVLNIQWPVEIEISALTGKIISKKEPFYSNILRFFSPK